MHNTLLNLSHEVIYPVLNVLHTHAADLLPRGGGIANMLPRYCIPAQRLAVTAIAHGVFLLQIACTVPAAPRGTAFSATAPTPCLLGFIGGGLAAGLGLAAAQCQTP